METSKAIMAFAALSNPTRMAVFRLLIQAGQEGKLSGELSDELCTMRNTMSANLKVLTHANLVKSERMGREVRYVANFETLQSLLAFLMEDCCGGNPETCRPIIDEIACAG